MIQPGQIFQMREKCKKCGNSDGFYELQNGQRVVRCQSCNKACYNAPKGELGLTDKPESYRKNFSDGMKTEILGRDGYKCVCCGRSPAVDGVTLHLAHIISVHQAELLDKKYGTNMRSFLNKAINLFSCCSECNADQGKFSLVPTAAVFVSALIHKRQGLL
jgi:ribosomal protein S27E